jgi:SAM-dependent methyltransferase
MDVSARAASFGLVAEDYHRWRPSYPPAAVDWLAPSPPAHVVELGAGTGKLTELLVGRGLRVDAVEHDARMLDVLGRHVPDARLHVSDASAVPLEDGSLDAVLVADAWHWFDPEPTVAEVRRVLRPGGWLGLVWNVVAAPVEPWEIALADDSQEYDRASKASTEGLNHRLSYLDPEEVEHAQFDWAWEVTADQWASCSATTSMAIAMSSSEQAEAFSRTRARVQQVCDEQGREAVPIRHVASCVRWTPAC